MGKKKTLSQLPNEKQSAAFSLCLWKMQDGNRQKRIRPIKKMNLKGKVSEVEVIQIGCSCFTCPCFFSFLPTYIVSLDSVLQDVRSLQRGMELARKEFMRQDDSIVLKDFLKMNTEMMEKLQADSKTAQVRRK